MRIVDEILLSRFRLAPHCEYCRRALRRPAEPHHLLTRGHGGGARLDIAVNLVSLGCAFDCGCHHRFHAGLIPRCDLVALVCQRERLLLGESELKTVLLVLQDMPTRRIAGDLERRLSVLNARQCELIKAILAGV